MTRPVAVLISDIHFTPNTLELASKSLRMAQDRALYLNIPLVIAGDTLDSKAIMRAECVNELIKIFTPIPQPETYILVGNHDLLNEKGTEHSLEFLKPYVMVIDKPTWLFKFPALIPYQTDTAAFAEILEETKRRGCDTIICHQGIQTAYMGHYAQDKTSLPKESFSKLRVISGHYHRRQSIQCGEIQDTGWNGIFSYIGNPYTQNFGEASDPAKGFQILHDDGSLEFIPTNLRKHVIHELEVRDGELSVLNTPKATGENDLIWLKIGGPKSILDGFNKEGLGKMLYGHSNYKLDLISTDSTPVPAEETKDLTESETFDTLIDATEEPLETKAYLKALWRETLEYT